MLKVTAATALGSLAGCVGLPGTTRRAPRLWYTDERLAQLRNWVAADKEPYASCYAAIRQRAQAALTKTATPYAGPDPKEYVKAMAPDGRDSLALALAYRIEGDGAYSQAALRLMNGWATHDPLPGSTYILEPVRPDLGMSTAMPTVAMIQAYALLCDAPGWSEEFEQSFRAFLKQVRANLLHSCEDWRARYRTDKKKGHYVPSTDERHRVFGGQLWQNHLGCHCMALACVGYALREAETVRFALDHEDNPHDLKALIGGAILMPGDRDRWGTEPDKIQPGEMYDRYRISQGKGLMYSFLHLRFLLDAAEIAWHNGLDFYSYTAPGGENLVLPFRFLGQALLAGPEALKGTCYEKHEGERVRIRAGLTTQWYPNLFLIGRNRYPDEPVIAEVCRRAAPSIFARTDHYEVLSFPLAFG